MTFSYHCKHLGYGKNVKIQKHVQNSQFLTFLTQRPMKSLSYKPFFTTTSGFLCLDKIYLLIVHNIACLLQQLPPSLICSRQIPQLCSLYSFSVYKGPTATGSGTIGAKFGLRSGTWRGGGGRSGTFITLKRFKGQFIAI